MRLVGLHHVQLAMPPGGETEAEAFYSGVLGLPRVSKPAHLEVRGGCWFESGFRPARKAHPALVVDDLAALRDTLSSASVEVTTDESLPGYERVYATDPFGNRLEFLEAAR